MSAFADLLSRSIANADVACLRIAGKDRERVTTIARDLMGPTQTAGIAVLLDDADLARKLGADGVHLADPKNYADARKTMGDRFSIGIACPSERHVAMEAAEAGADYIQFDFDPAAADDFLELVAWWAEMMTVPSVVHCPPEPAVAAAVIAAGADFLAPDASLWSLPDPISALASLQRC